MVKLLKMKSRNRVLLGILYVLIPLSIQAQQLSVMSYNIKYANENDGENSWSKREGFITAQMKFYEPDLFGVQEALQLQMDHFKNELQGYEYIGVGREDGKEKGEYSGIFYKSEKFKVLTSSTFWLSETPEKVSTGWDAALPRVCTYALFEELESGKRFWFFNTHFDHMGKEARKNSAELILEKIALLNEEELPVFLSGDFNLEPDSEGIQLIVKSLKDAKEAASLVAFGSEGTFNGYDFGEAPQRRIDYIFVNEKVNVQKYGVLTDSKMQRYPSDHFPVLVFAELQ